MDIPEFPKLKLQSVDSNKVFTGSIFIRAKSFGSKCTVSIRAKCKLEQRSKKYFQYSHNFIFVSEILNNLCEDFLQMNVTTILYLTNSELFGRSTASSQYFLQLASYLGIPVIAWNADNSGLERRVSEMNGGLFDAVISTGNVLKVDSFLIIVHYSRTRSVFSSSFFSCFSRCLFKHVFDQKKNAHRLPDVSRLRIHSRKRRKITSRTPCIRKFPEKQLQILEKKYWCSFDPISLVDVVL